MKRELKITSDGSHTVFVPELDETYHSKHGAINESKYVFLEKGWERLERKKIINVFEVGFGTGLNALLTMMRAEEEKQHVLYYTVEKYPLLQEELKELNYSEELGVEDEKFVALHQADWDKEVEVSAYFSIYKIKQDLVELKLKERQQFDLVYFDAFAPDIQPKLWKEEVFHDIYKLCNEGAILTTYCAKGSVRRSLQATGFSIERLPGPIGKREILRAYKK